MRLILPISFCKSFVFYNDVCFLLLLRYTNSESILSCCTWNPHFPCFISAVKFAKCGRCNFVCKIRDIVTSCCRPLCYWKRFRSICRHHAIVIYGIVSYCILHVIMHIGKDLVGNVLVCRIAGIAVIDKCTIAQGSNYHGDCSKQVVSALSI